MRKKIDDGGFETPYRLRKQVVEPVFGQIKQPRGFRQFPLRGVKKVRAEWAMICTSLGTSQPPGAAAHAPGPTAVKRKPSAPEARSGPARATETLARLD